MSRLKRSCISVLLLIAMCFNMVIPSSAVAAEAEKTYSGAIPSIFNPHNGETTRICWNFQLSHTAYVKVFQGDALIRTIQASKFYQGDYVPLEETWDGKDDQGNIVANGNYVVKIDAIGDIWEGRYPRTIPVSVLDSPAEDIAIAPNLIGDQFMVYGRTEHDEIQTIKVEWFIDGVSQGNANLGAGIWTTKVTLDDYETVSISAVKTNLVPIEVTDDEGNTHIEYVEEEIDLGPINVLKHVVRPFDRFTDLARYYYGDSDRYTEIIQANRLEYPYMVPIEARLLVLEPQAEGQPPKSEFADPEKMEDKCGLVDMLTGKTEFTDEPVNFATGNYVGSFDDIEVKGSFPITFTRFYNSRDRYNGDLGMNWHHNYEYRVQDMGDGTVQVIFSDGHRETYILEDDGTYTAPTGIYNQLERNGDRNYILTQTDLRKYCFDEQGKLISIIDPNGNTTTMSYEDYLLREIRTASGYLLIQYYADGRIQEISDNTGRSVRYNYSGDDLSQYTDPRGNATEYRYDGEHRLTKMTSPLGANITNVYDSKGRVIEQTFPDGNKYYLAYDDNNHTTTYTEPNGNQVVYTYSEDFIITEISYSDSPRKKTFNDRGELTSFTDKNGYTYSYNYDDQGNVTSVADPLGKTTGYTYDQNRKVTSITLPDGTGYEFTYDQNGNLLNVSDPVDRSTVYQYNQQGLPTRVTQPDGSIIQMNYDSRGNVTEMIDPLGNTSRFGYDSLNRVKTVTDANGNTTRLDYSEDDKIAKVTDALGNIATFQYSANGSLVEVKDPNNQITRYKYNNADQLIEITDPLAATTQYEYDLMGNISQVTDPNGGITTYSYDQLNRLTAITDPESFTASYEYDPNGNLVSMTDPRGNKTQLVYDPLNRLQKVIDAKQAATSYEYDSIGRVTRVINALNYATEYEYYEDGRVKTITDPLGQTTSLTYNQLGLVETVTDARGSVTTYQYNSLGKPVKMIDAEGAATCYEYDRNGNIKKIINPLGHATTYDYDALNRVTGITDPLGHKKSFEYNATGDITSVSDENGSRTQYKYDAVGNLTEVIDAAGHSTAYAYDKMGNLTEINQYRALTPGTTFARAIVQDQVYNIQTLELTNEESVQDQVYNNETSSNPQTVTDSVYQDSVGASVYARTEMADIGVNFQPTFFKYDKRGLLTEVKDAAGKTIAYTYDPNGNRITQKDQDDYVTSYEYDQLDQLSKINYSGQKNVEFTYNPLGQLTSMQDWLGTTSFELDPLGRITRVSDFDQRVSSYTWSPTGQKESITYPDGSQVNYQYDRMGRMTAVRDGLGKTTGYSYDPAGQLTERLLPNGSKTLYKFDPAARIIELMEQGPGGQTTDTYQYSYDPAGNKTQISKQKSDLDIEAAEGEEYEAKTYQYDALNRLIQVNSHNGESTKYLYDTLGNRVRMEEWGDSGIKGALNYEYDQVNQLIKTYSDNCGPDCDCGKHYSYDNRGNLTQLRSEGHVFNQYQYDAVNHLIKVSNKHADNTTYTYDGFGNRIKTITGLTQTGGGNRPEENENNGNHYGQDKENNGNHYGQDKENNGNHYGWTYDHGNPKAGWGNHQYKRDQMEQNFVIDYTSPLNDIMMIYGDHYQVQRYTNGIDRISMDMWMLDDHDNGWIPNGTGTNLSGTPEKLYYLQDELGSTTKLIGEDGKTSAHYNYDEFGRPLSFKKFDQNWPGPDNTFGYTGYQYDVAAGLYYAQARYYRPEIGRFISTDPWPGELTQPLTLNPYTYVLNNPMIYTDPLGLMAFCQIPDLGWGMLASVGETVKDILNTREVMTELVTAIWNKTLNWEDLKPIVGETFAPINYTITNFNHVFWGNPTDQQVYEYGKNAGQVLQMVLGGGGSVAAVKVISKFAPKLAKAIGKIGKGRVKTEVEAPFKMDLQLFAEGAGKTGIIHQHHQLPQQFKKQFEKAGLDIENYKIPLDKADHILKPDGLHTGKNSWNKQWDDFFKKNPNAKQDQILNQLDKMQKDFGLK